MKKTDKDTMNDIVDESSDESFPASDPPAWTETTAHPVEKKKKQCTDEKKTDLLLGRGRRTHKV